MSKRFDVKTCMMQEDEGKYVLYSEYAALEAELAQQTNNTAGPELADDVDNAMRLISAEYYDEGFDLLIKVANQLRAGA